MESFISTRNMEDRLWEDTKQRCTQKCLSCRINPPVTCQFDRNTEGDDLKQRLRDPIIHEFHPHPLRRQYGFFVCNACYGYFLGDSYSCRRCNFDLDVICASELPGRPEDESGLQLHFSHHHLLSAIASDDEEFGRLQDDVNPCQICGQLFSLGGGDITLGCKKCQFYIHASCKEALPREIERPYHQCTLFLVAFSFRPCDRCSGLVHYRLQFYCGLCDKGYCLMCCLLHVADLSKSEGAENDENARHFQHFFHSHELTQIEKPIRIFPCSVCGGDKLGPVYACLECYEFLVHVSCAKFSPLVKSYFHLAHSLCLYRQKELISLLRNDRPICTQCCKYCDRAYVCSKEGCNYFILDPECASLVPIISYKRHKHLLLLMENLDIAGLFCYACLEYLDCPPVFRCGLCNFNLHLQCGPLPSTLNTKYHVHELQLVDYFVEDDRDDFCCHVCEEIRDPLRCVYYCLDCDFVAHLKCLLSEITFLLKGKGGHVNLKTVGRKVLSKLVDENLVVKQIEQNNINQHSDVKNEGTSSHHFSDDEEWNIQASFGRFWDDVVSMSTSWGTDRTFLKCLWDNRSIGHNIRTEIWRTREEFTFDYSDKEFKRLIHELESLSTDSIYFPRELGDYVEEYSKSVTVLDRYLVPENLVPILNDLLDKYGDISVHSQVDPAVKSIFLCWVCAILEDLRTTKVVHVTEPQIKIWWSSLIFLKKFNFDTEFILKHVKQLVQAYFGVRAQDYIDSRSKEFEGTIRDRSEKIRRLERKIEKAKAEREEARNQLKDHQDFVRSATTSFIKQSIKLGRRLKWRYAATGLFNVNGRP